MDGKQRGQVGLLILIVMGVLVSLSLSVASRSLSDIALSRQERENSAAFHVAEQGVEEALNLVRQDAGIVDSGPYSDNIGSGELITGSYSIDGFSGLDIFVKEGEMAEVDLTTYVGNSVDVYWTISDSESEDISPCGVNGGSGNSPAAVEIVKIKTANDPVTREYFNPSSCDPETNNSFSSSNGAAAPFLSMQGIVVTGITKLRIRPIYNGATIGVTGLNLPDQLYLIQSEAGGGDAQKDIEVKRTKDHTPSIFDFAIFAQDTVIKQ